MSYKLSHLGRVVLVRWRETEARDMPDLEAKVRALHSQAGGQLIYISLTADDAPAPDEAGRRGVVKLAESIMPLCQQFYIVLEAKGFRGSVLRSALAGMMLLSKNRSQVKVVDSLAGVLRSVAPLAGVDLATLERQFLEAPTTATSA